MTVKKQAENEMRNFSRRLIQTQENDRAMLARDLHDDVSQRLAVLAIEVGQTELASPDKAQAASMQRIREALISISEDVHSLAYQLHPSILQELGLVEALRAECERRVGQSQLTLTISLGDLPAGVGKDTALCLFRVAQEALNNVIRHANSRTASITLRQMDGGLLLAVQDDGVGFHPAPTGKRRHIGLSSMRERVLLVNGTLDIESAPNQGTTIVAWVPTAVEMP